MKKLLMLLIISLTLIQPPFSLAADSSSSAGLSDDLKVKFKTLQEEIASRAARLKEEVGNKLQNKAYIGIVKSKSNNSLIVATKTGSRIININEYTAYVNFSLTGKKNTAKQPSPEDYIAALGDIDDNEVLTAKKIIGLKNTDKGEKKIVWGEVASVDNQTLNLQTKNKQILSFSWDEQTVFKKGDSSGTAGDVKVGNPLVIVGELSKGGSYLAQLIYIFPATANSASTASPSAK